MSNINKNIQNTLQRFLEKHKENYFIIGGHAAAYNLELEGITFRVTRDYDIVIVSEVDKDAFAEDLVDLLTVGEYQFGFRSKDSKRIAYRFESPKKDNYPEIIEFFVKEGAHIQSLDNRFAKLDIVYDDDKISAMVLDEEIYSFAKSHVREINGLMFLDKHGLIALKSYAYFENLKLYQQHKVSSDDYRKHLKDIVRIIGALNEDEIKPINGLPDSLKQSINSIITIVSNAKGLLKSYGVDKNTAIYVLQTLSK